MSTNALDRLWRGWGDLDGQKVRFQSLFFVHFVAFSGFVVFRNVYLGEMGMSGSAMGRIGFLMTAAGVAAQPLWGLVTDYLRAERPVLVVAAAVSAVGLLAYPAADGLAEPFLLVAAGTVAFSVFHAPIVPIANGLVLSRGYDYGRVRAFGSIAFGIGSLGFGFLVAALGIASIVYVYALGMVVLAGVVWTLPRSAGDADEVDAAGPRGRDGAGGGDGVGGEDGSGPGGRDESGGENADEAGDPPLSSAVRTLATNGDFLVVLLVAFVVGLSIRGGSSFFSVYMRAVEASAVVGPWTLSPDALTGVAWTVKTLFETVAFVYALRLTGSHKAFLVAGGAGVALPQVVYGLTSAPWAIVAVQVVGGLGYGLFNLAVVNIVFAVAADRVTSTAQTALTGLGMGLGGAVGQVVAGELSDALGIQRMYLYLAAAGFVGAAIGLAVRSTSADGSAGPTGEAA
ncbi:MAG: MFS transporter [Halosimplex sp.]